MRFLVAPARLLAVVPVLAASIAVGGSGTAAADARSKPAAAVKITFAGSGQISREDVRRYITVDEHKCYARETAREQASVQWRVAWAGVRASARGSLAVKSARLLESTHDGATLGDRVRDECDFPGNAPHDWVGSDHCDARFQALDEGSFSVASGGRNRITIAFAAPALSLPLNSGCTLTIRNEQFTGHVSVRRKAIAGLKKGRSLSLPVGVSRPGPGDAYEPRFDCSRPAKPYDNYSIQDSCVDLLAWSGRLTVTKL